MKHFISTILFVSLFTNTAVLAGPGSTGYALGRKEAVVARTGTGKASYYERMRKEAARKEEAKRKAEEKKPTTKKGCALSSVEGLPLYDLSGETEFRDAFFWAARSCPVLKQTYQKAIVQVVHYFTREIAPSDPAPAGYGGAGKILSVTCTKYQDLNTGVEFKYDCQQMELAYAPRV